jgi:hypothetical protein
MRCKILVDPKWCKKCIYASMGMCHYSNTENTSSSSSISLPDGTCALFRPIIPNHAKVAGKWCKRCSHFEICIFRIKKEGRNQFAREDGSCDKFSQSAGDSN